MYRPIACLVEQHAAWVVPLAGLICWVSLHTALRLNRHSLDTVGMGRWVWLVVASFSAGAGIWCTHFIGMLGYDPGFTIGYRLDGTLLSLVVSVLSVLAAFGASRARNRAVASLGAGLILGLGVAAMHGVGTLSLQVPGTLAWDQPLALAAVAVGCALATAGFAIHGGPARPHSRLVVATVLTASVAAMHFTAMAALVIVPDLMPVETGAILPRLVLAASITAVMLSILGFGVLALFADRTLRANAALRASQTALRVSEERLALAVDTDGLWDLTLTTGAMWLSDRWQTMLGYAPGELDGRIETWHGLVHPEDAAKVVRLLDDHLTGRTAVFECEHRLRRKDGAWSWVVARGKVVGRDGDGAGEPGRPVRMVGLQVDTTLRREAERRIAHMAVHDALTGLPNRVLFRERLSERLAGASTRRGSVAVLACDLDRFKAVNDTYGHPAGDALLKVIADRLRGVVRSADTIARLGGDEFAIILDRIDDPRCIDGIAQRLIEAVERPVPLGGVVAGVGISIGIAAADGETDADELFKKADIALYRAKAEGRNTFRYYVPGMNEAITRRARLERDLHAALGSAGGLVMHYQPILRGADGALCGFEALMRWRHPELGLVAPSDFIPLAEETGQIVALGAFALHDACRAAARWPGDLRVAVNVSAIQLRQPGLEQTVVAALAGARLPAARLEIEITESVLVEDDPASLSCLQRLKALGVRIALDDFGTGYSSLSYLRRFPFDRIKIDRSFIRDIADTDTAAIVGAIVGMAAHFGATVTAEGVETQDQFEAVRARACTEVQGYLFGYPVPAREVDDLIRRQAPRPAGQAAA